MRQPQLVPPLPPDLQNRSFKGMNCAGWDFSGRDIRGCDFRDSNLSAADFTGCYAGRSPRQIYRDRVGISIGLILGVIFPLVLMTSYKSPKILTDESIAAAGRMGGYTIGIGLILLLAAIAILQFLGMNSGLRLMSCGMSISSFSVPMFSLMDSPVIELTGRIMIFTILVVLSLGLGIFYWRLTVKDYHYAIGTNFQSANLGGANFTDARLMNCAFKKADLSHTNWTNVESGRCDLDVTVLP
jgi:hypothetical protein